MYLWISAEGESRFEELKNKPKWCMDSVHVFEGDFTVDSDRLYLVDTVCGIWAHALRTQAPDSAMLFELVGKHRASIFPKAYFKDLIEILEARIDNLDFEDQVAKQPFSRRRTSRT